ncbi:MAG: FeoB small GTPase domain-containing protein [Bacillota bacterium]|nr:FeoB small GTPase domain-containing protein [Bacillota bacterium]
MLDASTIASPGMPPVKPLQASRLALSGRPVVALAGNPNTGKSTVFNALTGLRQHTGNWPGKTVARHDGLCVSAGRELVLVDLPGTYSLLANSAEEVIARDFICFARPDATIVVVDATCLRRNLNLVLQVAEITPRVVVCLNLIDEARRKGIEIDAPALARDLGVPVVPAVARDGLGLDQLVATVLAVVDGQVVPQPVLPRYAHDVETRAARIAAALEPMLDGRLNRRWVALRLIEGDPTIIQSIAEQRIDG